VIDIPLIDELRETRRRLAEEQGNDVQRYAAMLTGVAPQLPGTYVAKPLLPPAPQDAAPPSQPPTPLGHAPSSVPSAV
jgi:hypothetical protein